MKIKECCTVESQECIAKGIYSMWISTKVIAKEAKAGQFISLFSKDGSRLLPRPISLCEIDREGGRLRIVYRVFGFVFKRLLCKNSKLSRACGEHCHT